MIYVLTVYSQGLEVLVVATVIEQFAYALENEINKSTPYTASVQKASWAFWGGKRKQTLEQAIQLVLALVEDRPIPDEAIVTDAR